MTTPQQKGAPVWHPQDLDDRVVLVGGASRGAGRGIARTLGQCGATVYVTARSSTRTGATQGRSETVERTAREVDAAGGRGIAVPCDHTDPTQVAAVFDRIRDQHGRLDLLVNNAWGGYEQDLGFQPFWTIPLDQWDRMFHGGLRAQFLTAQYAAPLLSDTPESLLVNTTSPIGDEYHGHLAYDVCKSAVARMTRGMAADLGEACTTVAVAPGWMRTERVLEAFGATETDWPSTPALVETESPEYVGRGIAHLLADPERQRFRGRSIEAGDLARIYGFTDIDGRVLSPFSERLPRLTA